jgi:hypothetical protein
MDARKRGETGTIRSVRAQLLGVAVAISAEGDAEAVKFNNAPGAETKRKVIKTHDLSCESKEENTP